MAEEEIALYERRRYSAVALSHPKLRFFTDVTKAAGTLMHGQTRLLKPPSGWDIRRVDLYARNLYPGTISVPDKKKRESLVGHDSYVAVRAATSGAAPLVLLAAPYRRLLGVTVAAVAEGIGRPDPTFLAFRMASLFETLHSEPDGYKATRITVQTAGEPGVSLVSLSGVSPLRSGLWHQIQDTVTPYGARVQRKFSNGVIRLHIDRLGNLFWHQLNEESTSRACATLSYLADKNITRFVDVSPLKRTPIDSDSD